MKITTKIDAQTQKRFAEEAVQASETDIYGVLVRNNLDIDKFDENSWTPSAEAEQWELDLKKKLELLVNLKLNLTKLG